MTKQKQRGHGEGSIYQRKDGRWAASISLEGGKRKTFYGKTRKEVQEKLMKALHEQQQGILATGPKQTLTADLVQAFCSKKSKEGLSAGTVRLLHTILYAALQDAVRWKRLAINVC